jgi:hypothetical protein
MAGFEVVDPRYLALYRRAFAVLGGDARVERVEVGGSIGAGTADKWSDLDLTVFVHPRSVDEFLKDWPRWLASITPTVFARMPIAPFILNTVTADGLTFDLVVHASGQSLPERPQRHSVGMLSSRGFDDLGDALEYAVNEQLRSLAGPFISLVLREEHIRHLTGVPHLLGLLTTVFLAETRSPPLGKIWNDSFTEEQRFAIASLPAVGATRERVVEFGLAVAELVLIRARPLFPKYGLEWPSPLAAVAAGRLREHLAVEVRDWLY